MVAPRSAGEERRGGERALPLKDESPAAEAVLSLPDLERIARDHLPPMVFDYIASGAADELTVRWNREAFDRIRLRPCVPERMETPDLSVDLLRRRLPSPILLAPTAYHRAVHPEGELATARGAGGATWIVSCGSNTSIEEIVSVAEAPLWFQLYLQSDPGATHELVQRVQQAGVEALVLTVDTPTIGVRDRQLRAAFRLPDGVGTPHLDDLIRGRRTIDSPERVPVTWQAIERLRTQVTIPLFLKGIMTAQDAARAREAGVDGLIVSNHGGRNLDTLPATIEALPEVVAAVAGRLPVLVDGGIRRGTDVVKAMALGATAVLIGRPYLYGLGLYGAAGVERVLRLLERETRLAMMLCGRSRIEELGAEVLW